MATLGMIMDRIQSAIHTRGINVATDIFNCAITMIHIRNVDQINNQ